MCAQHADGHELLVWTCVTRASQDPPRFTARMRELTQQEAGLAEADRRRA